MNDLTALSDLENTRHSTGASPRLDAVLSRLPKYARARVAYALFRADVSTLAKLCATKRGELRRWKNIGKKSITDLEDTLASLGLTLADDSMKHTKQQTPAQRVTNPVWLRTQIRELIKSCEEAITEDQARANKEHEKHDTARRDMHLTRVAWHRHWKQQLERVLRGRPYWETTETLESAGGCP